MSNLEKQVEYTKAETDKTLDKLITDGDLKSYQYETLYEDERRRDMCTNQRLVLEFPSGKKMTLYTFCSGSAENTSIWIE